MKPVLIVLPASGFDPSEAAIPWQALCRQGERVVFATPQGTPAAADPIMVSGEGLDFWGWIPLLKQVKLVGLTLRANASARDAWQQMIQSAEFLSPLAYAQVRVEDFDAIVLPGGHAKDIRPYLESETIQRWIELSIPADAALKQHRPVAAVCHGVLVIGRAKRDNGLSVLVGRKVTALPWVFESKAWQVGRIVRFWDPHYYRTYLESKGEPHGFWGVEQEIKRYLADPADFLNPQPGMPGYWQKTSGLHRDTPSNSQPAWVVRDGNLITARWPGDLHLFSKTLMDALKEYRGSQP